MCLLRAEFQRERASNFALLRRIPSTSVRRFLDHICNLDAPEADSLAEALAQGALTTFFPYEAKHPSETGNPAYQRFVNSPIGWRERWKYESVRALREHLAFAKSEPESLSIPEDVKKRIVAISPVKSTEIRKVVKLALSQALSSLTTTHNGGLWRYDGHLHGRPITVNIDYHQKYAQLEYGIAHPYQSDEIGVLRVDLNYERLLGVAGGGWDCLEQANLDKSITLLKELVIHCDGFLRTLPDSDEKSKSA